MLVKREALERAGNIDAIKHEIIDDCALGRAMKAQGPIWLGLTNRAASIRPYDGMDEIHRMISRSAYAQLHYSLLELLGTVFGMLLLFVAPPALAIFASGIAQICAVLAWAFMAIAFVPMLRFYRLSALWGFILPLIGVLYTAFTFDSRDPVLARAWRHVEGQGTGDPGMTTATDLASGKGHTDENFPVASVLIHPRHRPVILAFYRFARAADDIADNETASAEDKLRLLDQMHRGLSGLDNGAYEAVTLRNMLTEHNLTTQHASDLLEAFRRDVVKLRYANWDELMDYCRYSAVPVGRFVLDVHGEDRATWPASDALCAALQVINHLQDCGKDYRAHQPHLHPARCAGRRQHSPRSVGRKQIIPSFAWRDRSARAAQCGLAGCLQAVRGPDTRHKACPRSRGDSAPCRKPQSPAFGARSAVGACPPFQARGAGAGTSHHGALSCAPPAS